MKVIRVVAVLDGRPGHEKQTLGILRELKKKVSLEDVKLEVAATSFLTTAKKIFRLFFIKQGMAHPNVQSADLIIGTGTATHLDMLLYKQRYGIPTVVCMSPASYLVSLFDLCIVPKHDTIKHGSNIFLTNGAPNSAEEKHIHQDDRGLILLGGIDEKSHSWDSSGIISKVEEIVEKNKTVTWTISSSPRTPDETVKRICTFAANQQNVHFFDYRDTPKGWVESRYDESTMAWITSDSISMIYEALTAGCKVGLLPVEWKKQNSKFKLNEELLLEQELVISFSAWQRGTKCWKSSSNLNEAERCADRIVTTWF